jgi:hypothetical protein
MGGAGSGGSTSHCWTNPLLGSGLYWGDTRVAGTLVIRALVGLGPVVGEMNVAVPICFPPGTSLNDRSKAVTCSAPRLGFK